MHVEFPAQASEDLRGMNQEEIKKLSDQGLVESLIDWYARVKGNKFYEKYCSSLIEIKVIKRKATKEDIAALQEIGGAMLGEESGNAFLLGNDYNPDLARMDQDGRFIYRRKITTYPVMILSDGAISSAQERLKASPEVAALYEFTHEMGHFAAYVLQRFPMQLAQVILYSMLMQKKAKTTR